MLIYYKIIRENTTTYIAINPKGGITKCQLAKTHQIDSCCKKCTKILLRVSYKLVNGSFVPPGHDGYEGLEVYCGVNYKEITKEEAKLLTI